MFCPIVAAKTRWLTKSYEGKIVYKIGPPGCNICALKNFTLNASVDYLAFTGIGIVVFKKSLGEIKHSHDLNTL